MLNRETKVLVDLLQQTDQSKRIAVYNGVGYMLAQRLAAANKLGNIPSSNILVKEIVYAMNEIAIVDRDLLFKATTNMVNIKREISKGSTDTRWDMNDFEDIFFINKYFNPNAVESINKNMDIFKSAMLATNGWLNHEEYFTD